MFSSFGRLAQKNAASIIHNCVSWPAYLPVCVYQRVNCPVERQNSREIVNCDLSSYGRLAKNRLLLLTANAVHAAPKGTGFQILLTGRASDSAVHAIQSCARTHWIRSKLTRK